MRRMRLLAGATLIATYALCVRPRLVRLGATDEELHQPFPGAELIPDSERASATMAVTIDAPPASVWPWLVQMGYDRAGWYSWDILDNLGKPSAERIHPEWQEIQLGDRLTAMGEERDSWEVAALEPERFLGLRASVDLRGRPFDPRTGHPASYSDALWGFMLSELPGERTRLVVSGYSALRPRWLFPLVNYLVYEPTHVIMQARQLANLKRRVERGESTRRQLAGREPDVPRGQTGGQRPMTGKPDGRAATGDDVRAVATCLTSAFYEDPVWGLWAFPDEASRAQRLFELMRFFTLAGVRHPWLRMTDGGEAVALWLPPGVPEFTPEEEIAFGLLLESLFGERAGELAALFEQFDAHHAGCTEPHYYLSLWATHRDHAGHGLGTALIRENLARIDSERMPAYLESTNPANIPRYEAAGFRRRGEFGPQDGPVITTMWREAR